MDWFKAKEEKKNKPTTKNKNQKTYNHILQPDYLISSSATTKNKLFLSLK